MSVSFRRFGRRAILVEVPESIASSGAKMKVLRERIVLASGLDVVVGDGVLLAVGDEFDEIGKFVEAALENFGDAAPETPRSVDVLYDGADLAELAATLACTPREIVRLHEASIYEVGFLGFMPGFPYLRGLDARLVVPRRRQPRARVPSGSVAVAAEYCGIYPFDGPGGWNLVGRIVGTRLFDANRSVPVLFSPGERVQFRAIETLPVEEPVVRARSEGVRAPALRVLRAPPLTTVQDEGRAGKLGLGIPSSGPVDPELYRRSVRAVDAAGSAAIEFSSGALHLEALVECRVAIDGEVRRVSSGETLIVEESDRLYRYLALEGGIDVPEVLGSRSTLLVARLGGFLGRNLRAGDVLGAGNVRSNEGSSGIELRGEVFVEPGPDYERFSDRARRAFFESEFEIGSAFDRTGVRLGGASLDANALGSGRSIPMLRGAIQVTPDGTPIVLGPDHPTTGGYPVIAVLAEESFGAFGRLRPGARVRFEPKVE